MGSDDAILIVKTKSPPGCKGPYRYRIFQAQAIENFTDWVWFMNYPDRPNKYTTDFGEALKIAHHFNTCWDNTEYGITVLENFQNRVF